MRFIFFLLIAIQHAQASFVDVDSKYLQDRLYEFASRERGSVEGRNFARAYLKQEYAKLGYHVYEHAYPSGANVIAEKIGSDPSKVVLFAAHLDSVHNPGADDDASGIVAGLGIAKELSKLDSKYSVKFLAFDEEERRLIGSKYYVRHLRQRGELDQILAVFNADMIGYKSDGSKLMLADCGKKNVEHLSLLMLDVIRDYKIPLEPYRACSRRGDHLNFWRALVPSIALKNGRAEWNPCYHKSCDTADTIDFEYLKNIANAIGSSMSKLILE